MALNERYASSSNRQNMVIACGLLPLLLHLLCCFLRPQQWATVHTEACLVSRSKGPASACYPQIRAYWAPQCGSAPDKDPSCQASGGPSANHIHPDPSFVVVAVQSLALFLPKLWPNVSGKSKPNVNKYSSGMFRKFFLLLFPLSFWSVILSYSNRCLQWVCKLRT